MGLNVELVSQFAKLTANKKETKKESTAWGEVVEITESGKTFVKLDGSDRVTPVETVTEAKVGDRVSVTIKNHAATVMGNASSQSMTVGADGTVKIEKNDFKNLSADNLLIRGELKASKGFIDELTAKNLVVEETLTAHAGEFDTLKADVAEFERLSATYATFDHVNSKVGEFRELLADYTTTENLKATYATIDTLNAEKATITELLASKATIVDLDAVKADIGSLDAGVANINTLIFGSASGTSIHSQFANSVVASIGDAQINSAMIKDLSTHTLNASQITAGDIITDNVKVKSEDGSLMISGPVMQIGDGTRTRIQIGKDAAGAYSFSIFDKDGNALFYEDGITGNAIPDKIINNDMVADDAAIDASKLDIDRLFEVINEDGTHTLNSTKVKLDEEGQTLDVAFGSLATKVNGISVGGRNLIAGTSLETIYSGTSNLDLGYTDVWSAKTINTPTETEYIVSFDAKADEEIDIRCFFFSPNTTLTSESSTGNRRGYDGTAVIDGTSYVHITTEWKRYWVKWTQTPANAKKNVIVGRHSSLTNCVYIRAVKLEVGNKATDWTPAPEDVDGALTTLDSKYSSLKVTVDGFESTIAAQNQTIAAKADGSEVTTLKSNYNNLSVTVNGLTNTVGQHTTQIASKADGSEVTKVNNKVTELTSELGDFKSKVSETYVETTDFNKLSNDFNNLSIGGRNLLLNTGGGDKVVMNNSEASASMSSVTSWTNIDGVLTLNCSTSGSEVYYRFMAPIASKLYGLEPGETYIFSGKVKLATNSGTLGRLAVRTQHNSGSGWTGGIYPNILTSNSSEWKEFEAKFTIETSAKGYYVSLQLDYVGSWVGTIQLKELKLEKGNKRTEWTPAPEDAVNDINAVVTRMTSAETAINQNKDAIDLRATKTEVSNAVSNGVAEAKTYAASYTDAQIKVSSDAILLGVGATYVGGESIISSTYLSERSLGGYPSSGYTEGISGTTISVPKGNEYILSFEAKSTVAGDMISCHFYSPNTTQTVITSTDPNKVLNKADGHASLPLTTEWKRYWIKYTQDGAGTTTVKNWIIGRRFAGGGSGSVSVRNITLTDPSSVTSVSSQIKQLVDSISLSVTSSAGSKAGISITANGSTKNAELPVRTAFANDTTAVTISAGKVTFNSNTIVINSTNFTLDASGNITASNAVLNGTLTTIDGSTKAIVDSGGLELYANNNLYGFISSKHHPTAGNYSLTLTVPQTGSGGLKFVAAATGALLGTSYVIYYEMQPTFDGDIEYCYNTNGVPVHEFVGSMRFMGITQHISPSWFNSMIYLKNQACIGWTDKDGGGPQQLISFDSSNILNIGSSSYDTRIGGMLTLKNNWPLRALNTSGNPVQIMYFSTSNNLVIGNGVDSAKAVVFCRNTRPNSHNSYDLGTSDYRWRNIWSVNPLNGSDRRIKKNITALSDIHSELFDRLKPVQYEFIDILDRTHYGLIAQDVEASIIELGIGADDLGLVYHTYHVDDETGELADDYSIGYNNLIPMLIHEVQKLKKEIKTLKGE